VAIEIDPTEVQSTMVTNHRSRTVIEETNKFYVK
jgi:hypothetical protein